MYDLLASQNRLIQDTGNLQIKIKSYLISR